MQLEGYEDFQIIGSGGNAHVYRARSLRTGDDVAVKILRGAGDSAVNRRFERERQFMADLGEIDGVVPVLESGTTTEGDPFLVMPLYTGGSLQTELEKAPLPWRESVEIARQISDALTIAHDRRILHLDVKPANVLLDADGQPWLADFGIAETVGSTASMSAAMITPSFTPPERLRNTKPSEHTDIYGVCAMLFALVAGGAPFGSGNNNTTPAAVMLSVLSDPVPVERLPPETDPHLVNLLRRGLAKNIDERPQSARELSRLLTDVLEGRMVTPPLSAVATGPNGSPTGSDATVHAGRGSLAAISELAPDRPRVPTAALSIGAATAVEARTGPDRTNVWLLATFIAFFTIAAGAAFALIGTDGGEGTNASATEHPSVSPTADGQPTAESLPGTSVVETEVSSTQEVFADPTEGTNESAVSGGLADEESSLATSGENERPPASPVTSVAVTRPASSASTTTALPSTSSERNTTSSPLEETTTSSSPNSSSSSSTSTTTTSSTSTSTTTTTTTTTTAAPAPVLEAGFRATKGPAGQEQTITFANITDGEATSYTWDFGDGQSTSTAAKTTVTHTYDTPGTYSVTITASAPDATDSATHAVRVDPNS